MTCMVYIRTKDRESMYEVGFKGPQNQGGGGMQVGCRSQ